MQKLSATSKKILIQAAQGPQRYIFGQRHVDYLVWNGYLKACYMVNDILMSPDTFVDFYRNLPDEVPDMTVLPSVKLTTKGVEYLAATSKKRTRRPPKN